MKKNLAIVFSLLIIIVYAVACATAPPVQRDINTERIVDVSYDEVWAGVIEFFASNNISIQTIEKDSGIIVSELSKVDTGGRLVEGIIKYNGIEICDCGKPGLNQIAVLYVKFNVFIKKVDNNRTSIKVNTKFAGTYYNAVAKITGSWDCVSTGNFEQYIINRILEKSDVK